ncbi:MAG: stalk domain-containing protein, partial [Defluviitaleaceae bacterium]|nr:stalk domain-containing protein [Defluviitaleaceae bacterium]
PQLFGRRTASLQEFWNATSNYHGYETLIFPVNFFNTSSDFSIVEPIISQGRLLTDTTLSYDVYQDINYQWILPSSVFETNGRLSLFNRPFLSRYVSPGRFFVGYDTFQLAQSREIEVNAVFAPFPLLIVDNERLNISPTWYFNAGMVNNNVFRAFMGQREDGTFIVGNTTANISQLQDIVIELGLVNATNIDGGASASIMLNGNIVTPPGRALASVALLSRNTQPSPSDTTLVQAQSSTSLSVFINNVPLLSEVAPQIIGGSTMLPLRAVVEAIAPLANIEFDESTQRITIGAQDIQLQMTISSNIVNINNQSIEVPQAPIIVSDRTLVPLRVIAEGFGASVEWDASTQTVSIEF